VDDLPGGCLFELVYLPYRACKWFAENSRFGSSRADRENMEWWKRFAILGTVLIIAGIIAYKYFWE